MSSMDFLPVVLITIAYELNKMFLSLLYLIGGVFAFVCNCLIGFFYFGSSISIIQLMLVVSGVLPFPVFYVPLCLLLCFMFACGVFWTFVVVKIVLY